MCRIGSTLAAVLTLVMFEAYLRSGEMLSLRPSSFLAPTECGVRSWVILLFPQTCTARSKTGEARRHDQSRLKTLSVDGTSVREVSATTTTGQALAQPSVRRVLFAVPRSRRKPAGGCGTISRPPLWSFGGQGRKPATVGVHTKTRTMKISQVCSPLREKLTCQPKLVRARSIGPGTLRALQQPPALRFASWPCPTDTTSTTSSFVIELFSAGTDLQ